ncbi:MAG: 2-amino-4-hydroxy-6-hydroxymethyldihydropteridine diphosphokinase [Parachlamydia sp.]|jgi:2-amino-4-hydroxy-6-hydroxymethyldihydropteridine diphosphokinase|nr:2-amino-4-hydroxy-6-hydroxymethyldihydropteridine diphosphokinase [Parachlamydia sp.]
MLVYLSLGGNFDETPSLMHEALEAFQEIGSFVETSSLYETAPFEAESSRLFFNLVCRFDTPLDLLQLFDQIEMIEKKLGKKPKPKWESRPIDIDLLFYGQKTYVDERLQIPHPRWKERLFVLQPLLELTNYIEITEESNKMFYDISSMAKGLAMSSPNWGRKLSGSLRCGV